MAKAVTPSRHGRVREQWRGSGRGRESEAGSRSWAEGASTASGWQGGSGNGGGDGGGGDDEGGEGSGEYDGVAYTPKIEILQGLQYERAVCVIRCYLSR